jgi:hypothetical protein
VHAGKTAWYADSLSARRIEQEVIEQAVQHLAFRYCQRFGSAELAAPSEHNRPKQNRVNVTSH